MLCNCYVANNFYTNFQFLVVIVILNTGHTINQPTSSHIKLSSFLGFHYENTVCVKARRMYPERRAGSVKYTRGSGKFYVCRIPWLC